MGKMRVKLPSILKAREWPSCKQNPRTMSFREEADHSHIFKTLNSVYFDRTSASAAADVETPESWFSRNTSGGTASCPSSEEEEEEEEEEVVDVDVDDDPAVEAVIRGALASDVENSRLLFKPEKTSSIFTEKEEEKKKNNIIISSPSSYDELVNLVDDDGYPSNFNFKESVVMAMESEDPYMDFRRSMEEMVETHGLIKDWACLEELLGWYLRVNGKNNHAYNVGAFVDLLLAFSALDSSDNNNNNNNSNNSNPIICNQYQQEDEDEDEDDPPHPPPPCSTNNIIGPGCRGSTLSSSSSSCNSCSSSSSLPNNNNIIINTTNHKKQLSITSFSSAASSFRSSSSELD